MKTITHWRTVRCPNDPARYRAPETLDHFHMKGFVDGKHVITTRVVRVKGRDIWTESGSHYHLGPVAPDFAAWLADNGLSIDEVEPVKLIPRSGN
jgi:hypothetical protein